MCLSAKNRVCGFEMYLSMSVWGIRTSKYMVPDKAALFNTSPHPSCDQEVPGRGADKHMSNTWN